MPVLFNFSMTTVKFIYYATYTAYNGFTILPQLIETKDFIKFNVLTLNGKAVQNKGMALFPRKIGDRYAMLSRQDGENNHIMFSDNIHFWQESQIIQEPEYPWEFIQIGNCGSPLETDEGWIVLTHGVGPMRQYCIGAMLLDLENPAKIIARLDEPLLTPHEKEREGYVPNVVYSCGAIIHNNKLIIPYAMSDINSGIATVDVKELINCMHAVVSQEIIMNNIDEKYRKYFLVKEMLEVKKVLAAMDPLQIFEFTKHIKHKKILLTGEGSSRIFPAKKVIYDARHHNYKEMIITEGASQSAEYNLDDYTVFIASNSGKTKEGVKLIETLRTKKHKNIIAVVAHKNTEIMNNADYGYLLESGHEEAVAATKTVDRAGIILRYII